MHQKVAHLSSVHPPHDQRILLKECAALAQAGYDVRFVVPHSRDEVCDGVKIVAIRKPKNRIDRMTMTVWKVYKTAREQRAIVYHFHDPELIPVGILLKLLGNKVIYDVHEDLPRQVLAKGWIPAAVRKPIGTVTGLLEVLASRIIDGVVTATPVIANRFPANSTVAVQNFPISAEFTESSANHYDQREPIVAHIGRIATARGAHAIVESMSHVPLDLGAKLVLAGKFIAPLTEAELSQVNGWSQIEFVGWRDRAEVAEILGQSRIGLVVMQPIRQYIESQPTKLFEYMAAGLPVVAADFPVWREFVERADCGILVDPTDPSAIGNAITWLLENPVEAEAMGSRGQSVVFQYLNWEQESKILLDFYANRILS